MGAAIPLAYGFVRATGMQAYSHTDTTGEQYGVYLLGDGEWDGCDLLWNDDQLVLLNTATQQFFNPFELAFQSTFTFHTGADAPLGTPTPDAIFTAFPAAVTPLMFSRLAYYTIKVPANPNGSNSSLSPIGDFRAMRCRIFDADGNQTAYGFTTNPAWHWVDAWLRLKIKPEYSIDPTTGAQWLSSQEAAFFDWQSIHDAATYFDQVLPNGQKRFQGSYAFPSQTTLTAVLEQILLCCRSYQQQSGGKLQLICDKPRSPVFTMSAKHLVPNTFKVDEQQVHQAGNRYTAKFLDMNVPVVATIASMTATRGSDPSTSTAQITTTGKHPCAQGDLIIVGGTPSMALDAYWIVTDATDTGITAEYFEHLISSDINLYGTWTAGTAIPPGSVIIDPNGNFQQQTTPGTPKTGANPPAWPSAGASAGTTTHDGGITWMVIDPGTGTDPAPNGTASQGSIGYPQSRFMSRAPQLLHGPHALAKGQVLAPGVSKVRSKQDVALSFGNCAYDQAMRLLMYEMYRDLGIDSTSPFLQGLLGVSGSDPWKAPVQITLQGWLLSVDPAWNRVSAAKRGDVIAIDASVSYEYQGEYEIIEARRYPFQGTSQWQDGTLVAAPDSNDGRLDLVLRTYDENVFFDLSPAPDASYATVPDDALWQGNGPVNSNYQVLSATLSATLDGGTTCTIAWSDVELQLGGAIMLKYNDGSATGEPLHKLYAYVDDPYGRGGSIPVQFTQYVNWINGAAGRMLVGEIDCSTLGGTGGSGPVSGGGGGGSGGTGGGGAGGGPIGPPPPESGP